MQNLNAINQEIPITILNKMLGNVQNFYYSLLNEGWFLPLFDRNCITFDYLWNVFLGKYFRIKRNEIKQGILFKNITKTQLLQALNSKIDNLGFDTQKIPEKQWMINVLFTVNPNHEIFEKTKISDSEGKISIPLTFIYLIF